LLRGDNVAWTCYWKTKKTQKHRSRFLRTLQIFKKRLTPLEAKATASCPEPYDLLRSWIEGGETCPELQVRLRKNLDCCCCHCEDLHSMRRARSLHWLNMRNAWDVKPFCVAMGWIWKSSGRTLLLLWFTVRGDKNTRPLSAPNICRALQLQDPQQQHGAQSDLGH
jgi:hypothetical protein